VRALEPVKLLVGVHGVGEGIGLAGVGICGTEGVKGCNGVGQLATGGVSVLVGVVPTVGCERLARTSEGTVSDERETLRVGNGS